MNTVVVEGTLTMLVAATTIVLVLIPKNEEQKGVALLSFRALTSVATVLQYAGVVVAAARSSSWIGLGMACTAATLPANEARKVENFMVVRL